MRLSPTSVCLGLIALGLPIAIAVGWHFAAPAGAPPELARPGGAGSIGTAPATPTTSAPDTPVDWSPPARAARITEPAPAPSLTGSVTPATPPPSAGPASRSAPPSLTLPALPTLPPSTETAGPPPSLIVITPESDAPEEFDLNTARLVRRP